MTADLDTLLRDAGRGPTVDLDVDEVHTRGRRRALHRRVAAGTGALVLVGALAIGIPQLPGADRPGIDPIDDAPTTESPADLDGAVSSGVTTRAALAAELARDVGLHHHDAADGSWTVERTRVDGTREAWSFTLPPTLGDPVVDRDGGLWSSGVDGRLLRDGEPLPVPDPELGDGAWLPVGTDDVGNVVVSQALLRGGDAPDVLHSVGPDGVVVPSDLEQVTASLPRGAGVFAFDEGREHVVVLASAAPREPDETHLVVLLVPHGGEPRDLLAELPVAHAVAGRTVVAVQIVAGEAWLAVVADDGTSGVVRVPLDPAGEVTVLPTADPRGLHRLDGQVASIEATDDGEVVLLGRQAGDEGALAPYVVRPRMADTLAHGAITVLDAPGTPTLLPATGGDATALADCPAAGRNAPPEVNGEHLWFACYGDGSSLDPFPFFRVDLDPTEAEEVDLLRRLVTEFLAGPVPSDEAQHLRALAPPASVALTDITTEGSRVTITVDTVGETGVPTGATDGWAFRVALSALALQFDAYDEAVVVTDGVCGDWEGTTDAAPSDECIVWTEHDMPWNQ